MVSDFGKYNGYNGVPRTRLINFFYKSKIKILEQKKWKNGKHNPKVM